MLPGIKLLKHPHHTCPFLCTKKSMNSMNLVCEQGKTVVCSLISCHHRMLHRAPNMPLPMLSSSLLSCSIMALPSCSTTGWRHLWLMVGESTALHIGHLLCCSIHPSMHSWWKMWLQPERRAMRSFVWYSHRQMAQQSLCTTAIPQHLLQQSGGKQCRSGTSSNSERLSISEVAGLTTTTLSSAWEGKWLSLAGRTSSLLLPIIDTSPNSTSASKDSTCNSWCM
mmetsp:Transcript_35100/g.46368  ORF Transcript_35100/g.46368 Transcript_35100/m.46368 type:complete len:224 (-) Transcript_35100:656-1327(-)